MNRLVRTGFVAVLAVAVLAIAVLAIAVLAPLASAQEAELRDGSSLLSGVMGYTSHVSQQSGDRIGGGSWSLDYARVGRNGEWAGGFVVRRLDSDENFQRSDGREVQINVSRMIAAVQGRWFPTTGRLTTYLGALAGVHLQTGEKFEEDRDDFRDSNQKLVLGFSAGTMIHVTSGMFLMVDYTFHYVASSETIKNDQISGISAGLGFQFGGL